MALENKSATFQCKITGAPKPTITWYKGSREIFNSSKYYTDKEGDTYYLEVRDVYGEDADDYSCRAHNAAGHKSTRATLTIKSEYTNQQGLWYRVPARETIQGQHFLYLVVRC